MNGTIVHILRAMPAAFVLFSLVVLPVVAMDIVRADDHVRERQAGVGFVLLFSLQRAQ